MKLIKMGVVSLIAVSITACTTVGGRYGFFKDETQSYKSAEPIATTVVVPQNLTSTNFQDYYEVPQPGPEAGNGQPTVIPPGSNLQARTVVVSQQDRIRNAENAKILGHTSNQPVNTGPTSVDMNFSQAWMKVGQVLRGLGYKIVEKDNVLGTYYVIDTHATGGKVKKDMPIYQVHLKPSHGGTAVSVSPGNPGLQSQLNRNLNG